MLPLIHDFLENKIVNIIFPILKVLWKSTTYLRLKQILLIKYHEMLSYIQLIL